MFRGLQTNLKNRRVEEMENNFNNLIRKKDKNRINQDYYRHELKDINRKLKNIELKEYFLPNLWLKLVLLKFAVTKELEDLP